mmetsp:Transcript_106920/g.190060  ORF Transcript_106920/g.190060 Transcript_106920/m.190060 type:complete len:245 (+) Transcript_106920:67-801(+)
MAVSLSQIMQEELMQKEEHLKVEREQWADMLPEEDEFDEEAEEEDEEDNSAGPKRRVRRNRRRRNRKAKSEATERSQSQEAQSMQLGLDLPVTASRQVRGNVVTWSDLLDPSDASPSQASTSVPSPTPTPPVSARVGLPTTFFAQPVPMVLLPVAYAANFNQPPAGPSAEAQPWTYNHSNALRHWQVLCQGLGGRGNAELETSPERNLQDSPEISFSGHSEYFQFHLSRLQGLLQSASQVPYED